jgi:hypothetical protein
VEAAGCAFRSLAQLRGELDLDPAVAFSIEEHPSRNPRAQHFLQAQRLGAELDLVGEQVLDPASLVFHRHGSPPRLISIGMELDDVRPADQAQSVGTKRHRSRHPHSPAKIGAGQVGSLVEEAPSHGRCVVHPEALEDDQHRLPLAIHEVLERRDREVIVPLAR